MTKHTVKLLAGCHIILLLLTSNTYASDRDIQVILPAETVLHTLQKALPFQLPLVNADVSGEASITRLNELSILGNTLFIKGVLQGHNLSVVTTIAGQNIHLKLGQVQLPISCNLHIRFDTHRQRLYVTPVFPDLDQQNGTDPSLNPLMGALGNKEYLVPFDFSQHMTLQLGAQAIQLAMMPVQIKGYDNSLIVRLQPRLH